MEVDHTELHDLAAAEPASGEVAGAPTAAQVLRTPVIAQAGFQPPLLSSGMVARTASNYRPWGSRSPRSHLASVEGSTLNARASAFR